MNESFADYLNSIKPNDEIIEVAAKGFLSEHTEDMIPKEMKSRLTASAANRDDLERELLRLERSPAERREACLAFLCWAWQDSQNRPKIRAAFDGAEAKLPAIESTLLALIALYGMYLLVTEGVSEETHVVIHNRDGSFEEKTTRKYASPLGVLSLIPKLFTGSTGSS